MRVTRLVHVALLAAFGAAGGVLVSADQQGQGQAPSPFPLSNSVREKGSSITGAFEGWYYNKDGSVSLLVGYFNRNTKQELDIPVGPNNHVEPGGPDQGQPTHFLAGRQFGVFSIKVPKDFGSRKLTWTIVANGQTNTITLHTKADWIVEPFEDPASKNTPPVVRFEPGGPTFTGPPSGTAAHYTTSVSTPLALITWATDEGPKVNVPPPAQGRGRGRAGAPAGFTPPPPLSLSWSLFRGPGSVTFDNAKPPVDKADGKATTTATFSAPGDYMLRLQGNDQTGDGGGGFQCCWTNTYVTVTVRPSTTTER
jgi:hypothetical protein